MRPAKCQGVVAGVQLRYYIPRWEHTRGKIYASFPTLSWTFNHRFIVEKSIETLDLDRISLERNRKGLFKICRSLVSYRSSFFPSFFLSFVYVSKRCGLYKIAKLPLRLFRCEPFNRETRTLVSRKRKGGDARKGREVDLNWNYERSALAIGISVRKCQCVLVLVSYPLPIYCFCEIEFGRA